MKRSKFLTLLFCLAVLAVPGVVLGVVEKKTGTEYPDEITIGEGADTMKLLVTGVGLREKTFLKVDVYTIVSYVSEAPVEGEPGQAIVEMNVPKRLQLDLRRGFSREKLINAFIGGIEKNYDDLTPFAADMETFQAYFTRDAQEGDRIIFHYCPAKGLTTELNGEAIGTIENFEFAKALWTVWLGKKPANGGLKKALLAELGS